MPKRILNCIESKNKEKDWGFAAAISANIVSEPNTAMPASKDLREKWWDVGDQGQTGSCVGWATAEGVLRWHLVKAGKNKQNEKMSPRFIWMASKETDVFTTQPTTFIELEGTSLKAAMDIARKFGSVTDAVLPFGSGKLYPGDTDQFYALASQRKISSYFSLGQDPAKWRNWIATNGPILTRLTCDKNWMKANKANPNLKDYDNASASGGHAVAMVGYTKDYIIIRNSWGTTWGDNGFAYAFDSYASVAFTEAYGATL